MNPGSQRRRVTPHTIRMSVSVENAENLKHDLDQVLRAGAVKEKLKILVQQEI